MTPCRCYTDPILRAKHTDANAEISFRTEWVDFPPVLDTICEVRRGCGLVDEWSFSYMFGDDYEYQDLSFADVMEMLIRKIGKSCESFYRGTP